MVKHIREMIHRVGSFDRFRKIVSKAAVISEGSRKGLKKLIAMHGAQDIRVGDRITAATQMPGAPNSQSDSIIAL